MIKSDKIIPYGRQEILQEDIEVVANVLQSDFLTQGPNIARFEKAFAEYVGSKYAVAVSNGTAALHLCALSLDVKYGEKIITSPITFSASANCIKYCGGEVDFVDIDPFNYLIDVNKLEKKIQNSTDGTYSGIVVIDFAGKAVNLKKIKEIAQKYNLWVIEDACHAPGGYFVDDNKVNQNCGNGLFADLSIFSFHPVKHIATGEGGMITTSNKILYDQLIKLRSHGITRNADEFLLSPSFATGKEEMEEYPGWYMEMQDLGYNYRITDFQCALGLSQLSRAKESLLRRKTIAKIYNKAFENKEYILSYPKDIEGHAFHLYVIEVEDRLALYNYLRKHNVYVQVHYIPVHLMPYYRNLGWKEGDLPISEQYYKRCLSLPMFPSLKDSEVNYVINTIDSFYYL